MMWYEFEKRLGYDWKRRMRVRMNGGEKESKYMWSDFQ